MHIYLDTQNDGVTVNTVLSADITHHRVMVELIFT